MTTSRKQQCRQINKKVNEITTFYQRLKAWRKKEGLSQEQAAARLGVSRSYLNEVENGRTPGRKLVNSLSVEEKPTFDYGTNKGCKAAFDWLLETMPLPWLLDRVSAIMKDETKSIEERLRIANAMMPMIERRKTESQILESKTSKDTTTVAKEKMAS